MAVKDTLPSENLKYDDIRDTLNANGGIVSNEISTAFKDTAMINKWSRHKPVRSSILFNLSDDDFKDTNFGLSLPNYYPQDFKEAINNATYDYLPPRGGASEPYRLGDFRFYRPSSVSPCKKCVNYTFDTTIIENQFMINLVLNHMGHDDYNIGLDEFVLLADKYLAVILEYDDGRGHIVNLWKTASTTLGKSGYSVIFEDLDKDSMHNIKYYVCASSKIQEKQTTDISYVDFYGLPFNTPEDASAKISIIATNPFSVHFLGTAISYDAPTYIPVEDAVPGGLSFSVNSRTGIWLQSELTAKVSYTLDLSKVKGEMRPCWVLGTSTDRNSTTGLVPMDFYMLKNGVWEKITSSTVTFSKDKTYTIRVGAADWAYYKDGVKEYQLKPNQIYDNGEIFVWDNKTGYNLGGVTSCRIGLTT